MFDHKIPIRKMGSIAVPPLHERSRHGVEVDEANFPDGELEAEKGKFMTEHRELA